MRAKSKIESAKNISLKYKQNLATIKTMLSVYKEKDVIDYAKARSMYFNQSDLAKHFKSSNMYMKYLITKHKIKPRYNKIGRNLYSANDFENHFRSKK